MKKNDFLCINNIVYLIYNEPDFLALRRQVLELVRSLIPYDFASFMTAEATPQGQRLTDPVCRPEGMAVEQVYMTMEDQDYSRWLMFGSGSQAVRASDLLPEAERVRTPYYQNCCAPFGLHYLVDAVLVQQGQCQGVLSLYRSRSHGDFTAEEVFFLQALSEHLAARFQRERTGAAPEEGRLHLEAFCREHGLTRREAQVLAALLQEADTASISEQLCISPHTLKKHQQSIYRKCGVGSRLALEARCWEQAGM